MCVQRMPDSTLTEYFWDSVAISSRGYINGELGVDWIRHFDEETKDRVGVRFLFVNGHSLHCTVEFLDYAAEHNIIVISYPPHTTHALQGLDVACFGPLKLYWSQEKTKWERLKKRCLGKNDFLKVYSLARRRAFTEKTIKSAFRRTRLVPFCWAAIELDKMAPALVDSAKGGFPLPLPIPARAVLAFHRQVLSGPGDMVISVLDLTTGDSSPPSAASEPRIEASTQPSQVPNLCNVLQNTSAGFLVSDSPLKSTARLPPIVIQSVPVNQKPDFSVLARRTPLGKMTCADLEIENERLREELKKAQEGLDILERVKEEAYAQLILRELHLDEVSARLANLEEKKKNPQKRLMSTKTARFMSNHCFREIRREQQAAKESKAAWQAEAREKAKVESACAEQRKLWRETEKEERGGKQVEALAKWEQEVARCKGKKLKLPKKPAIRKLFPHAPTPPHLKSQKQGKEVEEEVEEVKEEVEEFEEFDVDVESEDGSGDE